MAVFGTGEIERATPSAYQLLYGIAERLSHRGVHVDEASPLGEIDTGERGFSENAEPLSHLRQLHLRPLALSSVAHQREAVEPTPSLESADADLDRKHGPILPAVETLEGDAFAGGDSIRHQPHRRLVQADIELPWMHADQLGAGIAKASASLAVHVDHEQRFVMQEERVGRMVHEGAETVLALAEPLFGALALADIHDRSDELEAASVIPQGVG